MATRQGSGARPRSYNTDALVLHSVDEGEADRRATLLTPGLGKVQAYVRGARRITSRLGGHLDALNHSRVNLALGSRWNVVAGAESIASFGRLKQDLDRIAVALYLAELTGAMLPEEAPHPAAYLLLLEALRAIDGGAADIRLTARYLELRLLEDAGYMPELRVCVLCGRAVEPDQHRFAPDLGGVACDACDIPQGRALPLSLSALKVLRHFARSGMAEGTALSAPPALLAELETLLGACCLAVLERDTASGAFVGHLRDMRRRAAR